LKATINAGEIDAALAAKGFVRWLVPELTHELGFGVDVVPLTADDLVSLEAEGWVTSDEILKIYTYSRAAAIIQPSLSAKVQSLRLKAEIPKRFEEICLQKLSAVAPMPLTSLFRNPPPALAKAIGDVLTIFRSEVGQIPRKHFSGIRSVVFEHPSDRAALATVKALPGIETMTAKAVDFFNKSDAMALLGSAILVTPGSMPQIYKTLEEACEILDVSPIPMLYVRFGPLESHTLGANEPYIVLASIAISLCNRDELLFLLGHELGHIKAGHVPYHTLAKTMKDGASVVSGLTLGLSQFVFDAALSPPLALWSRRSEYTADRAGFLVCQDREVALRALMKLSGYPPTFYKGMRTPSIVAQAHRYRDRLATHAADRFFNVSNLWSASHPFTVVRAYELLEWLQEDGGDILKMTPGELQNYANLIAVDPHLAELQQDVTRCVADWAQENLKVHRSHARHLVRQMILGTASAKGSELEKILQIQLTLRKVSADKIEHWVYLLVNQQGKPTRVSVPVNRDPSWDNLPNAVREQFIRSGEREIALNLYTVK